MQVLWHVLQRGAEIVCRALLSGDAAVGADTDIGRAEKKKEESSAEEETYYMCCEISDIGWEKEKVLEGDTELRMTPLLKKVYLPDNENDALISIKLRAVRQAFEVIVKDPESRHYLKQSGKTLFGGLLTLAGKSSLGFSLVWEQFMVFVENPSNWTAIIEECQETGMQRVCFYDIFYESIVLKMLECGEHIPDVLRPTLRTPWISQGMKKTTVMFYAWSQIKRKKENLTRPYGLYHHLYEIFDYTDPEIMWAEFGNQSKVKDYFLLLKGQILSFIKQIFSLKRNCYDSPARLAVPVYSEWQKLVWLLQGYLEENKSLA